MTSKKKRNGMENFSKYSSVIKGKDKSEYNSSFVLKHIAISTYIYMKVRDIKETF